VSSDSGLYHRAHLLKDAAAEEAGFGFQIEGGGDISADDRAEVSGRINAIIARNKIDIQPNTFKYKPRKSGAALPLLMNLLVAVLLAAGVYFLIHLFEQTEESLTTSRLTVESAEGKVIETLKRDAQRRLAAKEQEISSIRARVGELNDERDRLRENMDAEIARRERALQAELAAQLEAERQKLQEAGFSEQSIETRLAELEAGAREQNRKELELLQQQREADIAAREATIAGLLTEQDRILSRAQEERSTLETALADQEARLEARLEEQRQALSGGQAAAEERLRSLREQADQEKMLSDQILGFYAGVREELRASRYDEALTGLDRLEQFLDQESVQIQPAIAERKPVDLFLIDSLRGLIRREQSVQQTDTASLVAAAELLNSLSDQVEEAGRLEAAGDSAGAAELHTRVLERIPAVAVSYAYLEGLEDTTGLEERQAAAARIAELERALRSERQKAQAAARTAAEAREAARDAETRAEEAARTAAAQAEATAATAVTADAGPRQALQERLSGIDAQFVTYRDEGGAAAILDPAEMRELLQAKLQVKELLASEPVRSEHPTLYETMERFYDAFALESQQEGQQQALRDVNTLTRALLKGEEAADLGKVWENYPHPVSRELLQSFLSTLAALLE
jgi:hypothetical protein